MVWVLYCTSLPCLPLTTHRWPAYLSGTTTATVLARAVLSEGLKSVAAGMNPMDLRRGINMAVDHVVEELKSQAKMIGSS